MVLPPLTTAGGVFRYIIGTILLMALVIGVYLGGIYFGFIPGPVTETARSAVIIHYDAPPSSSSL